MHEKVWYWVGELCHCGSYQATSNSTRHAWVSDDEFEMTVYRVLGCNAGALLHTEPLFNSEWSSWHTSQLQPQTLFPSIAVFYYIVAFCSALHVRMARGYNTARVSNANQQLGCRNVTSKWPVVSRKLSLDGNNCLHRKMWVADTFELSRDVLRMDSLAR